MSLAVAKPRLYTTSYLVIPARLSSTGLLRKLLLREAGKHQVPDGIRITARRDY
jgi:hypothetical protein